MTAKYVRPEIWKSIKEKLIKEFANSETKPTKALIKKRVSDINESRDIKKTDKIPSNRQIELIRDEINKELEKIREELPGKTKIDTAPATKQSLKTRAYARNIQSIDLTVSQKDASEFSSSMNALSLLDNDYTDDEKKQMLKKFIEIRDKKDKNGFGIYRYDTERKKKERINEELLKYIKSEVKEREVKVPELTVEEKVPEVKEREVKEREVKEREVKVPELRLTVEEEEELLRDPVLDEKSIQKEIMEGFVSEDKEREDKKQEVKISEKKKNMNKKEDLQLRMVDLLITGVNSEMKENESKKLLERNYNKIKQTTKKMSDEPLIKQTIDGYDYLFNFLNLEGVSNGIGLLLAGLSSIRPKSKITGTEDVSNVALGTALLSRGYNNIARFLSPSEEKVQVFLGDVDESKDIQPSPDDIKESKDSQPSSDDIKASKDSQPSPDDIKADVKRIATKMLIGGTSIGSVKEIYNQIVKPTEPPTTQAPTTRKVESKIDKKDEDKKDIKLPDPKRKYYPRVIYPDDEILEPTARKVLQNQYNLAKFDWINPGNVGGNNENNNNPFYKLNEAEIATRYMFWKEQVIEKENEYLKQLPPVISNKIKEQFPRSFLSSSERQPTRLDWLTKNPWQFPSYNSPYNDMTRVDGTNAFINNSILYGIVP
jgi:hypothetical protein